MKPLLASVILWVQAMPEWVKMSSKTGDNLSRIVGPGRFYRDKTKLLLVVLAASALVLSGCRTPAQFRTDADKTALKIIEQKQQEALGRTSDFSIERPAETFRKRLMVSQKLPYSSEASLGTDALTPIEHWPEKDYPPRSTASEPNAPVQTNGVLKLSLVQALQVAAYNNFDYQTEKENIFKMALSLDLERNNFRNIFNAQVQNQFKHDTATDATETANSGDAGISRTLANGASVAGAIAIDLANLLTAPGGSSLGIAADASVSIPLLRGSGRHIVTEPLTQAERDVTYAIWDFEQFRKEFAVKIASAYFGVLRQVDALSNSEENYGSLIRSARRSRRLADAGRLQEIQVDQAVQNELRARQRWIGATQSYKRSLDSFKPLLGLAPDAEIELDQKELSILTKPSWKLIEQHLQRQKPQNEQKVLPADATVKLTGPDPCDAGPLEIDKQVAVKTALADRLDLRSVVGKVYDAQRAVVVAADALGAELTLFGSASSGGSRSIGSADESDIHPRFDKTALSSVLTLDLAVERTKERNDYRNSLIDLDRSVRSLQQLEDQVKLLVRNALRKLLEERENLYIQAKSVGVAEKRVKSVTLFLEAGRAQMRDLLESQDALLSAQNGLTSAAVDYRIAELELQRDMGVLTVNEKGLWKEYSPEAISDVQK